MNLNEGVRQEQSDVEKTEERGGEAELVLHGRLQDSDRLAEEVGGCVGEPRRPEHHVRASHLHHLHFVLSWFRCCLYDAFVRVGECADDRVTTKSFSPLASRIEDSASLSAELDSHLRFRGDVSLSLTSVWSNDFRPNVYYHDSIIFPFESIFDVDVTVSRKTGYDRISGVDALEGTWTTRRGYDLLSPNRHFRRKNSYRCEYACPRVPHGNCIQCARTVLDVHAPHVIIVHLRLRNKYVS